MNSGIILTGGPGTGKTSLINALSEKGHSVLPEISREIIRIQKEIGGNALPWVNPNLFHHEVLKGRIAQFEEVKYKKGPVFLDRGIPDSYAYLEAQGIQTPKNELQKIVAYQYHPAVFITPPWKEIFLNDSERWEDFAQLEMIHEALCSLYEKLGYEIVILPKTSVSERIEFLFRHLNL
jgi:predicted ATPase